MAGELEKAVEISSKLGEIGTVARGAVEIADEILITDADTKLLNSMAKFAKVSKAFNTMFAQPQPAVQTTSILDADLTAQLNNGIKQKIVDHILPNLFSSPSPPPEKTSMLKEIFGVVKSLAEHPDSPMARGIANTLDNVSGVLKNRMSETTSYNGNGNGNKPSLEEFILSLNPDDLNDLNKFMELLRSSPENPQISDLNQLRQVLLIQQNKLKGLENTESTENTVRKPKDINRQLIQQYDNPDAGDSGNGSGTFFNNEPPRQSVSMKSAPLDAGLREDEFILSLNPDDPISQQQYMAYRTITGVPLDVVKKMMIKEQNKFRDIMMKGVPVQDGHITTITNNSSYSTSPHPAQDSIQDDEIRTMKKEDFYKEIGFDKTGRKEPEPIKEAQITRNPRDETPDSASIKNIMVAIQNIGENFDNSMKQMGERIKNLENQLNPEVPEDYSDEREKKSTTYETKGEHQSNDVPIFPFEYDSDLREKENKSCLTEESTGTKCSSVPVDIFPEVHVVPENPEIPTDINNPEIPTDVPFNVVQELPKKRKFAVRKKSESG